MTGTLLLLLVVIGLSVLAVRATVWAVRQDRVAEPPAGWDL